MTIKEIAELANVSPGTVDRVIHKRGGVSMKTMDSILKILEEHNFERNVIASTLAKKKKYLIAALVPSATSANDFWHKPHLGIQDAYRNIKDFGFRLENFYFDQFDESSFQKAFKKMIKAKPDGVILSPLFNKKNLHICKELERINIPYLFINIDVDGMQNLSYIGQDSKAAGLLAAKLMHMVIREKLEILIVRKKRKISDHHSIENRISGFHEYFERNKLKANIIELELEGAEKKHLDLLTKTLLKNHTVQGLFVPSSYVNVIAWYIEAFELKHINLIGFDIYSESVDYLKSGVIDFLITQKPYEQGFRAIKTISDYLLFGLEPVKKQFAPIKIITKENVDFHQWNEAS